jgi:SnoaL-like domain
MSEENVERYRRSVQALNRRDPGALLALIDAEVEAVPTVVALGGDVRGHDGVRPWYAGVIDVFPDFTIEVGMVRDLGVLKLAAIGFRGHGAGSDTPF